MSEPTTEAGRQAWARYDREGRLYVEDILAIEAEARRPALDRQRFITELDKRIPPLDWPDGMASKVLDALDAAREDGT